VPSISEHRARLVYEWLTAQAVGMQIKGFKGSGSAQPVDHSDTEAQRRRNRRVELVVE
jgi:outer membrane protein OmpA-like peptidoglycan-associated protein